MKNFIAALVVGSAVFGAAASSYAQAAGPAGGQTPPAQGSEQNGDKSRADIRKEALASLNLTADQKKKIKDLHKANKAKSKQLKDDLDKSNASEEEKKNKMMDLRKQEQKDLRAILTADQVKQFEAYLKDAMKKARQNKDKNPGGGN